MMKAKIVAFALACFGGIAFGQTTTVTGSVTDTDNQVWANATVKAFLMLPGGPNTTVRPTASGVPVSQRSSTTAGSAGAFTLSLASTDTIDQAGAMWQFTICPNVSITPGSTPGCYVTKKLVPAAGLTLALNGVPAPRVPASAGAYAYADTELLTPNAPGAVYYNVGSVSPGQHIWNGTSWSAPVGGSGGGITTAQAAAAAPVQSVNGATGAINITSLTADAQAAAAALSAANTEASNRAAAVSGEASRATSAEGTNASAISTETTNRTAAVSGEASARATAVTSEATRATGQETISQHQANAMSPLDGASAIVCDAVATYTVAPIQGGVDLDLVSVAVTGTDNTAAWAAFINSLGTTATRPVGGGNPVPAPAQALSVEGAPQTAPQAVGRLPYGCRFRISDSPVIPEGVSLDGGNSMIFLTAANPSITKGAIKVIDRAANQLQGRSNTNLSNINVTCEGSWTLTSQTYAGIYVEGDTGARVDKVSAMNCPIGYAESASEYATHTKLDVAHNRVGLLTTSGPITNYGQPTTGTDTPGYPNVGGGPEIDNTWLGTSARNNGINMWLEASASQQFIGGTASYGFYLPILFGDALAPYIDNVAVSGTFSCTANATIPVTTTDSAGVQAEVVLFTGSGGTTATAFVVNGGKGYTSPTFTVPSTGTNSCTTPPTLTPHILNMASWGMYQSGGVAVPGSQNVIRNFDIEAVSQYGHPSRGLIAYEDGNSSQNTIAENNFALDGTYITHVAQFDGKGNNVAYNRGEVFTDPYDGTKCPYLAATSASIEAHVLAALDPALAVCYASNKNYMNDNSAAFEGFDSGGNKVANGFSVETSNLFNPFYQAFFRNQTTGVKDTYARYAASSQTLLFGGGSAALDFGIARNGAATGNLVGGLTNLPLFYNGTAIGANIISGGRSALNWAYDTNGDGTYAVSEFGQYYGSDNKLHDAHYTCTQVTGIPASTYSPTGCVKDFDAGVAGTTVPGVLPTTLYSAAGTAIPACVAALQGESTIVKDATNPTYLGAYTSGGAITAAVICSYNGTAYSWLTH